jgi:hypothetical protein
LLSADKKKEVHRHWWRSLPALVAQYRHWWRSYRHWWRSDRHWWRSLPALVAQCYRHWWRSV